MAIPTAVSRLDLSGYGPDWALVQAKTARPGVGHAGNRMRASEGETHMEIQGAGGPLGPQPIYPRLAAFGVESGATVQAGALRDQVEISPLGQMLDGISRLPEIRHEKVDEIRRQIAAGAYDSPEKWEIALDRLSDELRGW